MNPLLQLFEEIAELESKAMDAPGRTEHWKILTKIDHKKDHAISHLTVLIKDLRQAFPEPHANCPDCREEGGAHLKECAIRRADEFLARRA